MLDHPGLERDVEKAHSPFIPADHGCGRARRLFQPAQRVAGFSPAVVAHKRGFKTVRTCHQGKTVRLVRAHRKQANTGARPATLRLSLAKELAVGCKLPDAPQMGVQSQKPVPGPRHGIETAELSGTLAASTEGAAVDSVQAEDPDFAVPRVSDEHSLIRPQRGAADPAEFLRATVSDRERLRSNGNNLGKLPLRRRPGVGDTDDSVDSVDSVDCGRQVAERSGAALIACRHQHARHDERTGPCKPEGNGQSEPDRFRCAVVHCGILSWCG